MTLNELYLDLRKKLITAGIDNPEFEAKEILHVLLGKNRHEIVSDGYRYVAEQTPGKAADLIEKRLSGMPLAYVLGQWDFFGVTLEITPDVLIPRSDTEILAAAVISTLSQKASNGRLLDLCCGSGCIGLAAASRLPDINITLADISPEALAVAKRNAAAFRPRPIIVISADALAEPSAQLGMFDAIVCNPPYIAHYEYDDLDDSVKLYEPPIALKGGEDGLDFYRAVSKNWIKALKSGGTLLFETGYTQASTVADILLQEGFVNVSVHKDLRGIDRVVIGEKLDIVSEEITLTESGSNDHA